MTSQPFVHRLSPLMVLCLCSCIEDDSAAFARYLLRDIADTAFYKAMLQDTEIQDTEGLRASYDAPFWRSPPSDNALVVHGLLSSPTPFMGSELEAFLKAHYTNVYYFQYGTYYGIDHSGRELYDMLLEGAQSDNFGVDVYAHSMGGLVSRWAIEWEGAAHDGLIRRLVTFGSPHAGTDLARGVLGALTDYIHGEEAILTDARLDNLLTPSLFDLAGGGALEELNEVSSHEPPPVHYYCIAASDDIVVKENESELGAAVFDATDSQLVATEATVEGHSVLYLNLSARGVAPDSRTTESLLSHWLNQDN